jgi:hypothetical protein
MNLERPPSGVERFPTRADADEREEVVVIKSF